jgi:predicted transcriptional regulator of viral defense system
MTQSQRILELAKRQKLLRTRELTRLGISREQLKRLYSQGLLDRISRGVYVLANVERNENQSLAEACKRVPHGIVCLLSALRFHKLTTQAPFEVWIAISVRARQPKVDYPPLRIVRFSGAALTHGVELKTIEHVEVRITNPVRTVVDCFRYRNKIGLDIALEALRDCWRKRKASIDDLYRTAKALRMANVMRPYLDTLS